MKKGLSVITITKNSDRLLKDCFLSVKDIADEIVVVDNNSTDNTLAIAKQFKARVYDLATENFGQQKAYGVSKTKFEWVLALDSDEIVSDKLQKEIKSVISKPTKYYGFKIPYQNHLFGKPIHYGGENYLMLRLFKKKYATIKNNLIHESFKVKNFNYGRLKNRIYHYSYISLWQMYSKFTDYAIREARQKHFDLEKSSLKKIFAYPVHMFWARFVKDQGYKDGPTRIFLDLGFSYMEWLSYVYLAVLNLKK